MTPKKKILLYNPKAVFFDMPLALLAIGSVLDSEKYEIIIVDGRIDEDPIAVLKQHIDNALCFGTTVITGAPIKDALEISEKVKALAPSLPVIWGGWHTALFATQPIEEHSYIDITVQGQGEETFKELVERLDNNSSLEGLKGTTYRDGNKTVKNPPRPIMDMDEMPRVNYDLIDVEKYFEKKGKRQFDFISSIGCFFRCAFCADPFVFKRKFSAISPKKMVADLAYYHDKYKFDDLNFQDETFFTYAQRIEDLCTELIATGLKFTWAATMRADQGERLSDEVWELSKKSGLRRLLIGVESGSQEMMDWLKKDIKLTQVFYCADKCKDLGIDVIFPFIVGFPNETPESVTATIDVIKQLGSKSPGFQTPVFYFKPYPGSQITLDVVKQGYKLPETTEEWADFDYIGSSGPWVSREKERFFEAFKFYMKLAYGRDRGPIFYALRKLSQWRCKKDLFTFPIEKFVINILRPEQELS